MQRARSRARRAGRTELVGPSVPPPRDLLRPVSPPLRPQPPLRMLVLPAPAPGPRRFPSAEAMQAPSPRTGGSPEPRVLHITPGTSRASPSSSDNHTCMPLRTPGASRTPCWWTRSRRGESGPDGGVGPEKMLQLPRVLPGLRVHVLPAATQHHPLRKWKAAESTLRGKAFKRASHLAAPPLHSPGRRRAAPRLPLCPCADSERRAGFSPTQQVPPGRRPYQCPHCPRRFMEQNTLRSMRWKHPEPGCEAPPGTAGFWGGVHRTPRPQTAGEHQGALDTNRPIAAGRPTAALRVLQ